MQVEQLAHPLALDGEPSADLREGQALDGAQPEHLQLTLGLDVSAVGGERGQAVAVKLADQLVQLDAACELGLAEQLAEVVLGELLYRVDSGPGQAREESLAEASSLTRIDSAGRQSVISSSRRRATSEAIEHPARRSMSPAASRRSSASVIASRCLRLRAACARPLALNVQHEVEHSPIEQGVLLQPFLGTVFVHGELPLLVSRRRGQLPLSAGATFFSCGATIQTLCRPVAR
jgi:hypothetical protein